ncbi:MAG TPA: transposase [Bacteroidota bacterium]|nr:transposase [Bacteroidota bacterium]
MKYKTIPSETNIYFVSSAVTDHFSIFVSDDIAFIPLNSLSWLRSQGVWKLYAFCLMPNHLHILVELLDSRPIEKVMGQFHSFTGHEIINLLNKKRATRFLNKLEKDGRNKGDRNFMIWEDSLARCVEQENVLVDSIDYIHNNPCNKNWHLVDDPADYRYSSACFYDRGEAPLIQVDNYLLMLDGTSSR